MGPAVEKVGMVDKARETREFDPIADAVASATHEVSDGPGGEDIPVGSRVRDLVAESAVRGAPMISARAVQDRLFSVYDAAAVVPEALALVQRHLGLTLDRNWYSPQEIDLLAGQLDDLLVTGVLAGAGEVELIDEP